MSRKERYFFKLVTLILPICSAGHAQAAVPISNAGIPEIEHLVAVPPGVGKLTPTVDLTYTAAPRSGVLGVGWGLSASSTITRCAATLATDGYRANVQFTANDKLCLDGERLIPLAPDGVTPVIGASAADATGQASNAYREFRTESDSFTRIRAYGLADCTNAASGPAYFKVWSKTGQILEYGDNRADCTVPVNAMITAFYPSSQPIHYAQLWAMSRTSDQFGNHVDYKYTQRDLPWGSVGRYQNAHEWVLTEIQYSGAKVEFRYTDRSTGYPVQDVYEAYQHGNKSVNAFLLSSITTYVNASNPVVGNLTGAVAIQTTKLGYQQAPVTKRSRLSTIQTCIGDFNASPAKCMPAQSFTYNPGAAESYAPNNAFTFKNRALYLRPGLSQPGKYFGTTGVVTADFNGDGKTDILIWNADPSQNQLWLSQGDGTFVQVPNGSAAGQFNLTSDVLFSGDGCQQSLVMDFNNDGLPDILRYSAAVGANVVSDFCTNTAPTTPTVLFVNNGDGSFTRKPVSLLTAAGVDSGVIPLQNHYGNISVAPTQPSQGQGTYWWQGQDFALIDVDGDGFLDIVSTIRPARPQSDAWAPFTNLCASTVCTRVFKGDGQGTFKEVPTNIANYSLFNMAWPVGGSPFDIDQDGLPDLVSDDNQTQLGMGPTLVRSRGDGTFDIGAASAALGASFSIDYNGDGNRDLINPYGGTANILWLQDSPNGSPASVSNFVFNYNLLSYGAFGPSLGANGVDLNGDGREDIVHWDGKAYLSNGDGTFTPSTAFNVGALRVVDPILNQATQSFVMGDFSGRGQPEFLVMGPTSSTLYTKSDESKADLLIGFTDANGRKTSFQYVPLSNSVVSSSDPLGARYKSDRLTSNAATGSIIDLAPSQYVVATESYDDGVGGTQKSDFSYVGLKFDTSGRGNLGFRIVRTQSAASNGVPHTAETTYLQIFPYIGSAANEAVYSSSLTQMSAANRLSFIANVFCDQTSASGAAATAISSGVPCTSTAKIRRPFKLWSQLSAKDPAGNLLPTVTTTATVNADGDPTQISQSTTQNNTTSDTYTQTITSSYYPDVTTCSGYQTCLWVLGRVQTTTTSKNAPSTILSTSAGSASNATSTQGAGPTQFAALADVIFGTQTVSAPAVTQVATLFNTGLLPLNVTPPAAASVVGTGFTFVSTTCGTTLAPSTGCNITIRFAATAATAYSGTLTVATSAGSRTANLTATGVPPTITFAPNRTNWGTVGIESDSGDWPVVTNTSTVPILITAHTVVTGPAGAWANQGDSGTCLVGSTTLQPGASCQTFFGLGNTSTATGSFTATDQISYQAVGNTTSTFTARVNYAWATATTTGNAASLTFPGTAVNATSSQQTITLTNNATASPVNISVSMGGALPANFPMTNTCGDNLAAGASCTVSVSFNPTSVANGISAAVQVATTYPRVQNGSVAGYYYAAPVVSIPVTGTGQGGIPRWAPTSLSFSTVAVGASASQNIALYNDGNVAYNWASNSGIANAPAGYSFNTSACTSVAPGASCNVVVTFTPSAMGTTYSGTSVTMSAAPYSTNTFQVTGVGGSPVLSPSPNSLTLPNTQVGYSNVSGSVTVTNTGNFPANSFGLSVPTPFYIVSSNCGSTLASGASCSFAVRYSPTAAGTNSANVTITGQYASSAAVSLSAQAATAAGTLTPINFGNVIYGSYASASSTLTNIGIVPFSVPPLTSGMVTGSGFTAGGTNCGSSLAAGASCTISVMFTPTGVVGSSGHLDFPTGAGDFITTLTGYGVQATSVASNVSGSLAFGTQALNSGSPTATITVSNGGNTAMTLTGLSGLAAPFSLTGNTCTGISPGGTCAMTVTMSTSAPGSWSQSVTSAGATSNLSATVSGSVPGAAETGPWTNGTTMYFCSGQYATNKSTYTFTITGLAEKATLSPATSSMYSISYPTSGSTAWTNGATLNPGTYAFTIIALAPPSGTTPISMTFGGTGHVVSATINSISKLTCP